MVFNRKASFFLDLGSENTIPVQVAIAEATPAVEATPADEANTADEPILFRVAGSEQPVAEQPAVTTAVTRTTAEDIAAELRAAQESLPPPSNVTFAPDCLNPANALPSRRRLAGANLARFKDMASGMFRN